MNYPAVILRTSALLRTWLTVFQVLTVVFGGLVALGLLFGGGALLLGSGLWPTLRSDLDLSGRSLSLVGGLLIVTGLLYAAVAVLYVLLVGWAKEWEGQVARLSTSQGGNPARVAELSRTLGKWITASQWAPIVFTGLLLLAALAGASLLGQLFAAGEDQADTAYVAPLIGGLYAVLILISGGAQAVVGWLVLGALRRFMDTTTERLRGVGVAVTPSANTVGTWFIALMVLVGLGGGLLLLYIPVLLLGGIGASQDRSGDTTGLVGGLIGGGFSTVVSLAMYALLFLLLLWSRGFALAVAGQLDSGLVSPPPVSPEPGPVAPAPYPDSSPLH